jgi:Fur family peroxide stress response transcriptional regulator
LKIDKKEVNRRMKNFADVCRKSGAKLTHQRLEIYHEIARTGDHPDVETVYRRVRKRIPTVSLDTVYRTLWWLKGIGLIRTLGPPWERSRFDANLEHHHHFVCVCCGLTQDFSSGPLDRLDLTESIKSIGDAKTLQVDVKGICNTCAGKKKNGEEQNLLPIVSSTT